MRRELLATATELGGLRERIGRKPFDHIYETLQRRCALVLESQPITETMWRAAMEQGRWTAETAAVQSIQGRVFDLILSHHADRNLAYRDRALEELKNLIGFSTWVDPSHKDCLADICTGEACATVAIALDWLADELSEPDRFRCVKALREKGIGPYLKAVEAGAFWYSCYHNWNAVVNCGVGLAGLLLGDEEPAAALALAKAKVGLRNFFNALGREGGWDEGTGYWGYAMRYVLLLAEALKNAAGDGWLFRQRGMDATGLFPVYFSPHGVATSFGDRPTVPAWGVFYLLVKHYGLKETCWWLDRYAFRRDVSTAGYSDAGLALLFRPPDWENQPAPNLQPVKAFNEIGWAALADRWESPTRQSRFGDVATPWLYVALKTGDLSANHAQLDMNSIQFMVNGEILLHDSGNPDYSREYLWGQGRTMFYEVQARAHNTLTIGGREHRIDAAGSIVEAQDAPGYRWVAGDAGSALGEDVRFVRHLVMPVQPSGHGTPAVPGAGRMLIVLDEIRGVVPERVAATWHTPGEVALALQAKSGTLAGKQSRLHFSFAGTCPITVSARQQDRAGDGQGLPGRPIALGGGAPSPQTRFVAVGVPDTVIAVGTPPVAEAMLVSVFSPLPVGKVLIRNGSRSETTVTVGTLKLRWKVSRHNLQLVSVTG